MALTLEEMANLINDPDFRGRVKVAALLYAQSLSLKPSNPSSVTNWVFQTLRTPDQTAAMLTPSVVINPNVQGPGKDVTDQDLQAAVQAVASTLM